MTSRDQTNPPSPANDTGPSACLASSDLLLDLIPDLVFEFTEDGRYSAYHGGPDEELYCPTDDFLGRDLREVLPSPVSEKLYRAVRKVVETNKPTTIGYMLPTDGELRYYQAHLNPLESGNIIAFTRNMTDDWRAKTELEQSESRYRTLVNNIPGMVYRSHIDEKWSAVFVSPNVEDLAGYSPQDFISGRLTLSDLIHPEDRRRVRQEVMAAVDDDIPFQIQYRLVDASGHVHHVSERGQAVYAGHDDTTYIDGVVFDVTDMHRMRQRLLLSSKMAAVGSLATGVAHEINNPLAIAMANVEYVDEELGALAGAIDGDNQTLEGAFGDVATALGKVQEGIRRIHDIVDDLRTFSDAAESQADRIDLRRLVQWAVRRSDSVAKSPEAITTELEPVPDVWASEVGIVQVVWNLIDNALEAIERSDEPGQVTVSLTGDGDSVYLEVIDDGPGMSDEVARRAFEPFFTTKAIGQGAGLGLFVCQGLVEGMDGHLDVETAPDEGTRIQVVFPAFSSDG